LSLDVFINITISAIIFSFIVIVSARSVVELLVGQVKELTERVGGLGRPSVLFVKDEAVQDCDG